MSQHRARKHLSEQIEANLHLEGITLSEDEKAFFEEVDRAALDEESALSLLLAFNAGEYRPPAREAA